MFTVLASDLGLTGLTCIDWQDGSQLCSPPVAGDRCTPTPPSLTHYCTGTALPNTLVCHPDKANSERIAVRTSLVSGVDSMPEGMRGLKTLQSDVLAMQGELRRWELSARAAPAAVPPPQAWALTPAPVPVPPAPPQSPYGGTRQEYPPQTPYGGTRQEYPPQPAQHTLHP